jgi:hypothetical protein
MRKIRFYWGVQVRASVVTVYATKVYLKAAFLKLFSSGYHFY